MIVKEWLDTPYEAETTDRYDWPKRQRIAECARTLDYYQTCLNAVPGTPENRGVIANYMAGFERACEDMSELLKGTGA